MTVLKCLWRVLDFCRRLVLNLIFLGVLVAAALIWLFARPNTPAVEPLKSSKAPTNYFTPNILRKSWSRLVVSVVHLDALAFPVVAT